MTVHIHLSHIKFGHGLFTRGESASFVRSFVHSFVSSCGREGRRRGGGCGANCSDDLDGSVQPFVCCFLWWYLGCIFDFSIYLHIWNIYLTTKSLTMPSSLLQTHVHFVKPCLSANWTGFSSPCHHKEKEISFVFILPFGLGYLSRECLNFCCRSQRNSRIETEKGRFVMTDVFLVVLAVHDYKEPDVIFSAPRLLRYLNPCVLSSLRFFLLFVRFTKPSQQIFSPIHWQYRGQETWKERHSSGSSGSNGSIPSREPCWRRNKKMTQSTVWMGIEARRGYWNQSHLEERGQGKGTSCPENICWNKRKIKLGYCITSRHIMSMSLWNRNVCVVLFVMR